MSPIKKNIQSSMLSWIKKKKKAKSTSTSPKKKQISTNKKPNKNQKIQKNSEI